MVVIIGAGYWGTAIAYTLRQVGISPLLVDDQDSLAGSRNAAGVMSPDVYQSDKVRALLPLTWTTSELSASIEWAKAIGQGVVARGNFLNGMNGDTQSRPANETPNIYFPPGAFLNLHHPQTMRVIGVHRIGDGDWVVEAAHGATFRCSHVIVAAGYRTDEILKMAGIQPLGVKALFGRGVVGTGRLPHPLPLYVMTRPYTKVGVREWGSMVYVGATSEKTPKDKNRDDLDAFAQKYVEGFQLHSRMEGYRPVLDKFTVAEVAPHFIVATGGNRFGIGLAGLVANRVKWMVS
jgi:glycine/D-amino acid oxidase-like deaminating enzyme